MSEPLRIGGQVAEVDDSVGYWLSSHDFVSSDTEDGAVSSEGFGTLGFPRDFPAVYSQSAALKALIGRKGRIAAKRVAVTGPPSPEDRQAVRQLTFHPLCSFANAELASAPPAGLPLVEGWAVYEDLSRPPGTTFVAERYWWNTLPGGKWVDFTPRPALWPELLLAEAVHGAPKAKSLLTQEDLDLAKRLLQQRFPALYRPTPAPVSAPPPSRTPVSAPPANTAIAPPRVAAAAPAATAPVVAPAAATAAVPASGSNPPAKVAAAKAAASPAPAAAAQDIRAGQAPQPAVAKPASAAAKPASAAAKPASAAAKPASAAPVAATKVAAPLDYSKWSKIVDSDDEEAEVAPANRPPAEDYGIKDLMEGRPARKPLPVPDYLVGNTGGGGGTNCFLTICKLLDAEGKKEGSDNAHPLAHAFGKMYHCALHDKRRQRFYRECLNAVPEDAYVVMLGIGSILPMLQLASRKPGRALVLEMCAKLASLGEDILRVNRQELPIVHVQQGLDNEAGVSDALARFLPADAGRVVIVTERMAHDLLSNGIVPSCVTAHLAARKRAPKAKVTHIPQTVELMVTPMEIRTERLGDFDLRPFNLFRHTSCNEKADFWWWAVRLDNQPNTQVALLGPSQTLCGFDFNRSPEIGLTEVRRSLKLEINQRGRCNGVALWWTARCGDQSYSSRPRMAAPKDSAEDQVPCKSEWKQPVHYLAGETTVFVGDTVELLASITPRFTVRMMQTSPFSVEAPTWIKAPANAKFSATLPLLPYHFLMMTDTERLQVYSSAIGAAVRQQRKRLGRRPRVLDAGCGIGLLGMTAALEGADVWLCEAVPLMRQVCREVLAVNAGVIAEKRGMVQLLPPMLSTRLQVGEDIPEKFDIVVSEVMDLWCLGEGVIPTMRHAHSKLLADGGVMLPGRLVIFVQPIELFMWNEVEREQKATLAPLAAAFRPKFAPLRIAQLPHRFLTEEPCAALEIDLGQVPQQPADGEPNLEGVRLCIRMGGKPALHAKISTMTAERSGMLCGYGIWWAADLGNGNVITSAPSSPQRSWKQIVRWLDEPRFVSEGEEMQILACYNETQVNIEDMHVPQEMVRQYQGGASSATGAAGASSAPTGTPTAAAVAAAAAVARAAQSSAPAASRSQMASVPAVQAGSAGRSGLAKSAEQARPAPPVQRAEDDEHVVEAD